LRPTLKRLERFERLERLEPLGYVSLAKQTSVRKVTKTCRMVAWLKVKPLGKNSKSQRRDPIAPLDLLFQLGNRL
jgi:hypothetical protein